MAVEMAMVTPIIALLLALIFVYGRVAQVNGTLESGTRDGARSATRARTAGEARQLAHRAVREGITQAPASCRDALRVEVRGRFERGEAITVETSCTYGISDIGLPGAPGTITARSSFTSVVDSYRGFN
jgi:TadE-like protein